MHVDPVNRLLLGPALGAVCACYYVDFVPEFSHAFGQRLHHVFQSTYYGPVVGIYMYDFHLFFTAFIIPLIAGGPFSRAYVVSMT